MNRGSLINSKLTESIQHTFLARDPSMSLYRVLSTYDDEGDYVGTEALVCTFDGSLGEPTLKDQQIAAQRGSVVDLVLETAPPSKWFPSAVAWDSGTTYALHDLVVSGGLVYSSLAAGNANHTPSTSPTFWTLVNLQIGDIVAARGQKWVIEHVFTQIVTRCHLVRYGSVGEKS